MAVRQRGGQRGQGVVLWQVAQEAQDQAGADPQLRLRLLAGTVQAADHHADVHTPCGMGLRVKKQLRMHHVVSRCALKVSPGHVEKILLVQQHAGTGVVDVQKTLQVGEGIRRPQCRHTGVGQRHTVALGQRKNQLGLQ